MGFVRKSFEALLEKPRVYTLLKVRDVDTVKKNFGYDGSSQVTSDWRTIKVVPANYIFTNLTFQKYGDLREGEFRFFCRSDEHIKKGDEVYFDGEYFDVSRIEAYWKANEKVAKIIRIQSKLQRSS